MAPRDGSTRSSPRLTVLGGVPGTIVGALASGAVDGRILLVLSGVMLVGVGVRLLVRDGAGAATRAADRRGRTSLVIAAAFVVGLLTGLLANGGGFLLVPLFVVGYGLSAGEAAGTSMLAVGALVIPTLVSHWALGHIDWSVSFAFATGLIPGSVVGSRATERIPAAVTRPRVRHDAAPVRRVVPLDAGLRGRLHAPASVPAISPIAVRSQSDRKGATTDER